MGLGSFKNINIFVMKYYLIQFVYILNFFYSLKSKSTQMLRPQEGVLFNDTLLNFGLWGDDSSLPVCSVSCTVHLQLFTNIYIL